MLRIYTNPICPFAQRNIFTIYEKNIQCVKIQIPLILEIDRVKNLGPENCAQYKNSSLEDMLKIKNDYKEKIIPSGEVPVLQHDDKLIFESDIIAEYLDLISDQKLLPKDFYQQAQMRMCLKKLGTLIQYFYLFLQNQNPQADTDFRTKIEQILQDFSEKIKGDFYLGDELSLIEINLCPFLYRFNLTLSFYRDYELFGELPWQQKLKKYQERVQERQAFQQDLPGKEEILQAYETYANNHRWEGAVLVGRGQSKFGI